MSGYVLCCLWVCLFLHYCRTPWYLPTLGAVGHSLLGRDDREVDLKNLSYASSVSQCFCSHSCLCNVVLCTLKGYQYQ